MVLKIDMALFVIAAYHPAKFHQNPMVEFFENVYKPVLRRVTPLPLSLPKGTDWVKTFKNSFHGTSSNC